MKKYLLTGGFAAMLLLGACGSEEGTNESVEAGAGSNEEVSEEVETETVEEESNRQTENVTTEEVTTEEVEETENAEDEATEPETIDEVNEELENDEEVEDGTKIYGYNGEVVTEELDTLNVTRNSAGTLGMTVTPDMEWYFADEGYAVGDEVQMLVLEYTVENTVEDNKDFYIDQTTIITSTGEQIESEMFMESGLESQMLGAVQSTGEITFLLRNGDAEDIEWIDVIIPSVSDGDWNTLTDEYKQRIELATE